MADTTSPVGPGTELTVAIEVFLNHLQARQAARATVVAYRSDLTQVSARGWRPGSPGTPRAGHPAR